MSYRDVIYLLVFVSLMLLGLAITNRIDGYNSGYRQGQIDVLGGNSTYQLMEKSDKTRYWKEVESYKIQCSPYNNDLSFHYFENLEVLVSR